MQQGTDWKSLPVKELTATFSFDESLAQSIKRKVVAFIYNHIRDAAKDEGLRQQIIKKRYLFFAVGCDQVCQVGFDATRRVATIRWMPQAERILDEFGLNSAAIEAAISLRSPQWFG